MYKQPTLEIIRTNIIKRATCNLAAENNARVPRAASATNALLGHAPHLAAKNLLEAFFVLQADIILTLFAEYTRFPTFILTFIKIVRNFCPLLHHDRVSKQPMVE